MQTAPLTLLPVDPAPADSRREAVDRGFADVLAATSRAHSADKPVRSEPGERDATPADDTANRDAAIRDIDRPDPTSRARDDRDSPKAEPDTPVADTASASAEAANPAASPAVSQGAAPALDPSGLMPVATTSGAPADPVPPAGLASLPTPAGSAETAPAMQPVPAAADAPLAAASDIAAPPVAEGTGKAPAAATPEAGVPADAPMAPALPNAGPVAAVPPAGSEAAAIAATVLSGQISIQRESRGAMAAAAPSATPAESATTSATTDGKTDAGPHKPAASTSQAGTAQPAAVTSATVEQATKAPAPTALDDSGPRMPDAPQQASSPAHGHSISPSASFAHELRLASGVATPSDIGAARMMTAPAVSQVAVQISRAVADGQDKLTIDLRPAVLGRVSVSLELGHDHRVMAVISADRADTLDLLQRDARVLERALQDAGLKADSGSLSFNLNGNGARQSPFGEAATPEHYVAAHATEEDGDMPPATPTPHAQAVSLTGIDIHV